MADLANLHPTFRAAVIATGHRVRSGARATEEQRRLYDGWRKYGRPRFNPANAPGTSWHEYGSGIPGGTWALAVDFDGPPYPPRGSAFCTPIRDEPWHYQPVQVAEVRRVNGADLRLPRPPAPVPVDPDPLRIGGSPVLVLEGAMTRYRLVTHAGKVLDVEGGMSPGEQKNRRLLQWGATGGQNQEWVLFPCGPEEFLLVSRYSGRVLDAVEPRQSGSRLLMWDCHLRANQRWNLRPAQGVGGNHVRIMAAGTDLCLDVPGASRDNGAAIQLWTPNGGRHQVFDPQAVK